MGFRIKLFHYVPEYNIYLLQKMFSILMIVLICVVFLIQGLIELNRNSHPNDMDTHLYLADSIHIKDNGGILNFLSFAISGNYKEADRHPAYLLYLSLFASRKLIFYPIAKLMTLACGLVFVLTAYFIIRKQFGDGAATIAVFLLVFNKDIIHLSSMVVSTIPYALFMILSWHYITSGFNKNSLWITGGIMTGLAYMTKGSALFIIFAFIITILIDSFNLL